MISVCCSSKSSTEFPRDAAIPLLSVYPKEMKPGVQTRTCAHMSIVTPFTIAQRWELPRWPSTDEWISKMQSIYTMEYDPAIKRSEALIRAMTWMNLLRLLPRERSQTQKATNW